MNDLMSHTAGFDDNKYGQMVPTYKTVVPLGTWLKKHIPARVRAPGKIIAYGNYSAALAGYIIERASGMSYDEYVEKNILVPLGMVHTTSRQPAPAVISENQSQCYLFTNNSFKKQELLAQVELNVAPAGAFKSTASDIARFMIAHLNGGECCNTRIMQSSTMQLMHTRNFSHDAHVNGMAHGFWELNMNGQRIIGHAGSHFIFNSFLMLFPEQKLGVFIASNSRGGSTFLSDNYASFAQSFVDHFYPMKRTPLVPQSGFYKQAQRYIGDYHMTYNRSDKTPEKLISMIMSLRINADHNGLNALLPFGQVHFVEVEPDVFKQSNGGNILTFHRDSNGTITHGSYDPYPLTAFVKSKWFETPGFNLLLLGLCIVLFLSVLAVTLISLLRRLKRHKIPVSFHKENIAWILANSSSFLCLLYIAGVVTSLFNFYNLYTGYLPLWGSMSVLSIVLSFLVLVMVLFSILSWAGRFWGIVRRIQFTLVTLASAGFVWFMYFWNLLGKNF
jgi:hypothetical protein